VLAAAHDDYERNHGAEGSTLNVEQRQQVMALVMDFPRLWRDPATPQRERKRMVRLLLEDVTLLKTDEVVAHIRFRGGATQTIRLPLPLSAPELRRRIRRWSPKSIACSIITPMPRSPTS
jgi:hypothetical protein